MGVGAEHPGSRSNSTWWVALHLGLVGMGADFNGDGLVDLVASRDISARDAASNPNPGVRWYANTGTATDPAFSTFTNATEWYGRSISTAPACIWLLAPQLTRQRVKRRYPAPATSFDQQTLTFGDMDSDGMVDAFLLTYQSDSVNPGRAPMAMSFRSQRAGTGLAAPGSPTGTELAMTAFLDALPDAGLVRPVDL